jgi:hypothetical protein
MPLFGNISIQNTIDKPRRQRSKYGGKKHYEYHRRQVAMNIDCYSSTDYTLFGKPSPMEFGFGLFRQRYGIQSD